MFGFTTNRPFGIPQSQSQFGQGFNAYSGHNNSSNHPFGAQTPQTTTASTLFGAPSSISSGFLGPTTHSSSSSSSSGGGFGFGAFGGPSTTTTTSAFGGSTTSSPLSLPSPFGTTTNTTGTAFGFGPSSTTPSSSSSFGFGTNSTPGFWGVSSATTTPSFSFASTFPAFTQSSSSSSSSTSQFMFGNNSTTTTPTSAFTFGQTSFMGQRVGSRVASYAPTIVPSDNNSTISLKLQTISGMPVYQDKCHEELRWEDHQSMCQPSSNPFAPKTPPLIPFSSSSFSSSSSFPSNSFPSTAVSNLSSPSQPTLFPPSSVNPFTSPTTCTNAFAPKTPSFLTSSPSSSPSNLFTPTYNYNSSLFTPTPLFASTAASSPSFVAPSFPLQVQEKPTTPAFTPSSPSFVSPLFPSQGIPTKPSFNFNSTTSMFNPSSNATPLIGQTTSAFAPSTTTASSFPTPTPALFNNSKPNSTLTGFANVSTTTPPLVNSFFPQTTGTFNLSNIGQTQPGNATAACPLTTQGSSAVNVMQPAASTVTSPFGTLPAVPRMSIGCGVQYGISSMPPLDKHPAPPVRASALLTCRRLSLRRISRPLPIARNGAKVPFFSGYDHEDETASIPKAVAVLLPRDNPRALVISPTEPLQLKSAFDRPSFPIKDGTCNGVDENHNSTQKERDSHMTLSEHRAGEAGAVYVNGIDIEAEIEALMPKLQRCDYYAEPAIQELAARERAEPGFCSRVKDFVVGRHGYGSIKFSGVTDVRRLELDELLVQFNNREVIVYKDDTKKPPVGEGLNKPAEVTLLNIKCFDRKTGHQHKEGPNFDKYKEMLKRKAEEQGAEFVSYEPIKGEWKFRVNHF